MTENNRDNGSNRFGDLLRKLRRVSPALAGVALAACSANVERSIFEAPKPEFGPGTRVELVAQPVVIDDLAITKNEGLLAVYEISNYPDDDTDTDITEAREEVKKIQMSDVKQQALAVINTEAANFTYDPNFSYTSPEDLQENRAMSDMLDDIIGKIDDPDLKKQAVRSLDLAEADTAIKATEAGEKAIATDLLAHVENPDISQRAQDAIAGSENDERLVSTALTEINTDIFNAKTDAYDALYNGSAMQGDRVNRDIEDYNTATKGAPVELTWLKDQASDIIDAGINGDAPEDITEAKDTLLAAPEVVKDLALDGLDGEIAETFRYDSIQSYNIDDITAEVEEERQMVALVSDDKLRASMERYIDLMLAEKTGYMSDSVEAASVMALVINPKIKANAQAANGGNYDKQTKLDDAETKIEDAMTDAWLKGYRGLTYGSNSQATDINETAAIFMQQR